MTILLATVLMCLDSAGMICCVKQDLLRLDLWQQLPMLWHAHSACSPAGCRYGGLQICYGSACSHTSP